VTHDAWEQVNARLLTFLGAPKQHETCRPRPAASQAR
jgi:hypothetical protein